MVEITIRKRPREDAISTQRKFFRKTAKGKVLKGQLNACRPHATRALIQLSQLYGSDICATMYPAVLRAVRRVME